MLGRKISLFAMRRNKSAALRTTFSPTVHAENLTILDNFVRPAVHCSDMDFGYHNRFFGETSGWPSLYKGGTGHHAGDGDD